LPEWLYEEGIGENRAILVEQDSILEAAIELPDEVRVGSVVAGRLRQLDLQRQSGWVSTARGDVLVRPIDRRLAQGSQVHVQIVREQVLEPGHPKSLIGILTDEREREAPSLAERIGDHVRISPHEPDRFEASGWHELIEEAVSGDIPFAGGELRLSLTPAMTLFDVDGYLAAPDLAVRGAEAAARAIRRHAIGGSIGIDLPTCASRAARQHAATALDAELPPPFERTAVNGFGFVQVVRKRERQSIPELMQYTCIQSATRALLRRAERAPGVGARKLIASPAVISYLERRGDWLDELRRRIGAQVLLQPRGSFTTWGFHVQSTQS
jgi:Ribonuclease G/E